MGILQNISSRANKIMLFGFVELLLDLQRIKILPGEKWSINSAWLKFNQAKQDSNILTGRRMVEMIT